MNSKLLTGLLAIICLVVVISGCTSSSAARMCPNCQSHDTYQLQHGVDDSLAYHCNNCGVTFFVGGKWDGYFWDDKNQDGIAQNNEIYN